VAAFKLALRLTSYFTFATATLLNNTRNNKREVVYTLNFIATQMYAEMEVNSIDFNSELDVRYQLHALADLSPRNKPPVSK
jgi:hypothetical protein